MVVAVLPRVPKTSSHQRVCRLAATAHPVGGHLDGYEDPVRHSLTIEKYVSTASSNVAFSIAVYMGTPG